MKTLLLFLIAAGSLIAGDVKVFPVPKTDYAAYKTYNWLPPRLLTASGLVEDDPTIAPLIKKAVNRELAKKGFTEVPSGGSVQIVSIGMSTGTLMLDGFLATYGFDAYWGVTTANITPVTSYNREGTLAVALIDPKTKKGIWCGMATEALGRPGRTEKAIDSAAERMFKKYPPKK